MANLGELGFLSQFVQEYDEGGYFDPESIRDEMNLLLTVLRTKPQLLMVALTVLEVPQNEIKGLKNDVVLGLLDKVGTGEMEFDLFLMTLGSELAPDPRDPGDYDNGENRVNGLRLKG